jgi:hypothetical protein
VNPFVLRWLAWCVLSAVLFTGVLFTLGWLVISLPLTLAGLWAGRRAYRYDPF